MTTPGVLKGAASAYPLQRPSVKIPAVPIDIYS